MEGGMAVVYSAHTEACTLMLDENGVCEWAAPTGLGKVGHFVVKLPQQFQS